jgi:hypothetical protein
VVYLHPSWQLSAVMAGLCAATWLLLRRLGDGSGPAASLRLAVRSFSREFAVVMALVGLWQFVGRFVRHRPAGAMDRAVAVEHLQAWLHLPDQIWFQHLFLPHPDLVRALNLYYLFAHLNGTGLMLIWVWWRRREAFRTVRNTVVLTTLICLLIQLVPVAPPRFLAGFEDTARTYGQSVYGDYATGVAAQLTAMPSVHVAWAFLVAWYVLVLGSGWWRWLGVAHLVMTVVVVAATANHWWLDGIAAIAVAGVVLAGQFAGRRLSATARPAPLALATARTSGSSVADPQSV